MVVQSHFDDCMTDACVVEDNDDKLDDAVCDSLDDFNDIFKAKGIVVSWRTRTGCRKCSQLDKRRNWSRKKI